MTALAISPRSDLYSLVTIGDARARAPLWKTLLGLPRFGETHVDEPAEDPARRNIWATRLDEAVVHAEKPVLLVASGASCLAAAWWARLSPASYVAKVSGALLFNPPGQPDANFAAPHIVLPFPSAVIGCDGRRRDWSARVRPLADDWGSDLLLLEERGDTSAWDQAQALLLRVTARVVERDLRVAHTLGVPA